MSLINISGLTFGYDGSSENVFENVNIQLDTDWKLGLTGRNGRGKTTLLKLLSGELSGRGTISGGVDFEYFPYPVSNPEYLTIDVIRQAAADAEDWEILREMSLLKMNEDTAYRQFSTLSGGEQAKAMLAGLFLTGDVFRLIDEPTNHLDADGRRVLGEYLDSKRGFIVISHDRKFLDICTDHIMSINKCSIDVQRGNYSEWQRNKDMRDSFELAQNEKLKKDIKRLEAAAKRTAEWSDKAEKAKIGFDPSKVEKNIGRRSYQGAKAKKAMARSGAISERRDRAVREKEKLLHNIETTSELKLRPLEFHSERLAQLKDLSLIYGDKTVCRNVSFTINRFDKIALCGKNGCGKTSLLRLICGEDISYEGDFFKAPGLKISYVPQTAGHLHGTLFEYAEAHGIDMSLFLAILRKLDFSREHFEHDLQGLSDGQKKKIMLAGSLCESAHLYIWDEPLNFVDIISRVQIEELILKSSLTLIFTEHDEMFRNNIAGRSVWL